jgi:hypothetical protein
MPDLSAAGTTLGDLSVLCRAEPCLCLAEKLHKETIALEAERQQHDDTKKALSNQTAVAAALLKEKSERCYILAQCPAQERCPS